MSLRFIQAKYTPTGGANGWAVPPPVYSDNRNVAEIDLKRLAAHGFVEGEHFRVLRHSDKRLKRVVFNSDIAFIQAKMICS